MRYSIDRPGGGSPVGAQRFLCWHRTDPMQRAFQNPPESARPRVWWHWMNGNISKEGIKLDLEWMHRVGIAGFQNFDAALQTPAGRREASRIHDTGVEGRVQVRHRARRSVRHGDGDRRFTGLERDRRAWVPASQGMKKYVWSETLVEGRKPFTGKLAHPPSNDRRLSGHAACARSSGQPQCRPPPQFYADAAVVAFRIPRANRMQTRRKPRITSSGEGLDAAMLSDGGPGEDDEGADAHAGLDSPGSSTNTRHRMSSAPSRT